MRLAYASLVITLGKRCNMSFILKNGEYLMQQKVSLSEFGMKSELLD